MKLDIRKANQRGRGDHGWLKSWHTFSFANYHDPAQMGFSDLLVINDDQVAPGMGFGTHGHRDMEIFSYVLEGELAHKDSMGTGAVIKPGDVQMMSAGSGIQHSEFNPSKEHGVHFLQIWIVPNKGGVTPRYQQQHFTREQKAGKLTPIITDETNPAALNVYQSAKVFAGCFDGEEHARYALPANRFAYVHVARGSVMLNGAALEAGDGVRVREAGELAFSAGKAAEVLLFDLRPVESPR
jgi:quercetin 2,3-dioxygenase